MANAVPVPVNSVLLDTPYAMTISGSVASADACCAAAALDTRAEMARITASASAMNGGSTQSMRIHQFVVGKNQPPSLRADDQVHDERVQQRSPTAAVK